MGLLKLQFNLALILKLSILYCSASNIIIYEDTSKVKHAIINISSCSNLRHSGVGDVNFIELNDNCIRLHDKYNCSGNFIEVYKGTPEIAQWKDAYLNDTVKSTGPCPNPCYQQIYSQSETAKIYSSANYKGTSTKIVLDGCLGERQLGTVKSVKTHNNCIRFYSTPTCVIGGPSVKHFELRPGAPFQNDLDRWNIPVIKAISLCSFQCQTIDPDIPAKGQVLFFNKVNFGGAQTKLNLSTKLCTKISQSAKEMPNSIKLGNGTCAILFSEDDCTGTEYMVKVSVYNFNFETKSIAHCGFIPPEPTTIDPFTITSTIISIINDTLTSNTDMNNSGNSFDLPLSTITIISTAVCVGLLLLALAIMCLKDRLFISVQEKIAEKDVREFFDGCDISAVITAENSEQPSTELLAQSKPYNKQYNISRSRIDYDVDKILRKSDLDVVYKGTMADNLGLKKRISMIQTVKKVPVIVKIANRSAGLQGLQSLMKEVKVILHLGKHDNIAHMIGCCTENLRQGKLLVIMENCANGTLKSYLQEHRQLFISLKKENDLEVNLSKPLSIHIDSNTANTGQPQLDTLLLLHWCIEVSRGMEFLSDANIVHSDLAARNILLTDTLQAKISDFGLSRQMYCYSKNVHIQQEPLPWRWMAIESILQLKFTTKSDVWSYGVLCWEIFTLSEMPFEGIRSKDAYITHLEEGLRLEKPYVASKELYDIMVKCWEDEPRHRPTFMEMIKSLEEQLLLVT